MKDVVSASVHSITTAGEQHLYLDGKDADKIRGKRVCLLDDVISTGESLHATGMPDGECQCSGCKKSSDPC
mgnify:FL=1